MSQLLNDVFDDNVCCEKTTSPFFYASIMITTCISKNQFTGGWATLLEGADLAFDIQVLKISKIDYG